MEKYKCITDCTWNGRVWREGTIMSLPLGSDTPPEHFVLEKENDIDVDLLAGADLRSKTVAQLKELAKELNVYSPSLKSKDALIEVIESVEAIKEESE